MNESTDLPRQFFLKFYFVNVLYDSYSMKLFGFLVLENKVLNIKPIFFARRRLTRIFDRTIDWKRAWTRTFCSIRGRRWIETKSLLEINLHDVLMFYLGSQVEFRFISVFLFKSILSFFSVSLSLIYKNCKNPKKDENRKNHKSLNPALKCP